MADTTWLTPDTGHRDTKTDTRTPRRTPGHQDGHQDTKTDGDDHDLMMTDGPSPGPPPGPSPGPSSGPSPGPSPGPCPGPSSGPPPTDTRTYPPARRPARPPARRPARPPTRPFGIGGKTNGAWRKQTGKREWSGMGDGDGGPFSGGISPRTPLSRNRGRSPRGTGCNACRGNARLCATTASLLHYLLHYFKITCNLPRCIRSL